MADTENTEQDQGKTYDDELKGVLFINDKGDNPRRPDYRGHVVVGGTTYRISGWKRQAKQSGQTFLSLALTEDKSGPVDGDDAPGF